MKITDILKLAMKNLTGHKRIMLRVAVSVLTVVPVSYTHLDVYKRQGQHNSYSTGYSLHYLDADIVRVYKLIIRKIVAVVNHQRDYRAADKRKYQRVGHCTHHIPADIYTCLLYTSRCV